MRGGRFRRFALQPFSRDAANTWGKNLSSSLARYESDIATADAEVVQFTACQAAEFRNCFAVTAPVVVRAYEVHFNLPFELLLVILDPCRIDTLLLQICAALVLQGSNAIYAWLND